MLWEALIIFWYIIVISSIVCYAMLDGFDLGVGALHLFVKKDEERRIFLNAIGPIWDGNEVWLVVLVGALLAGFPHAYGTLFSAFYIPLNLLVFALIFRAVAIEFRSKKESNSWRRGWDFFFCIASILIALLVGMILGNLICGLALDANHNFTGRGFWSFFQPYSCLVGLLTLSLFVLHGAIFLIMKTEGQLQQKLITWIHPSSLFFIITYAITTMITLIYQEHMVERLRQKPYLFLIALVNMLVIANIFRCIHHKKFGFAFLSSCANILLLLSLFAVGTFPALLRSTLNPQENSITIFNAGGSLVTLKVLSVIVAIGLPLVFGYGFFIYRIFRGKVVLDPHSY